MLYYTLSDFHDISKKGFEIILPENTVKLINSLSEHVSSPTYIRTPVFVKKESSPEQEKKRRKDKHAPRRNDGNWNVEKYKNGILGSRTTKDGSNIQSNIVFKTPLLAKKEMSLVEQYIQKVRALLNKVASNSDIDLITPITDVFDEMLETDVTGEDVEQLSNKITSIMSTNSFYSDDYSRIYSILYKKYPFIQDTFNNLDNKYLTSYDEIKDVNPDEDYDTFCSINKHNDERRAKSLFYANLYTKHQVVTSERLIDIIYTITSRLYNNIDCQDKICENDEIIENICILLSIHTTDMFAKCSDIEITKIDLSQPISIQKFIVDLHQAKPKQYNGVSTKSLFKLMEMIELIHKK